MALEAVDLAETGRIPRDRPVMQKHLLSSDEEALAGSVLRLDQGRHTIDPILPKRSGGERERIHGPTIRIPDREGKVGVDDDDTEAAATLARRLREGEWRSPHHFS